MKELILSGFKELSLFVRIWDEVASPKGVVQIIHDCGEHSGRYLEFADFLNNSGYIVIAADLRAHGRTATGKLGVVTEKDYFNSTVNDNIVIATYAKEQYDVPLVIFGNAFGGQIALAMAQRCSEMINSCILMSTPHISVSGVLFLNSVLRVQATFVGREKPAKLLLKMLDLGSIRHSDNSATPYNWLTNDDQEIEKYINDEYSAHSLSIGFYQAYLDGVKGLYSAKRMSRISKSLPMLLIAGDNDPVAEYGKSVNKLYEDLADATINNLQYKIYLGKKHDLLHEIKRTEAMVDVVSFIDTTINQ